MSESIRLSNYKVVNTEEDLEISTNQQGNQPEEEKDGVVQSLAPVFRSQMTREKIFTALIICYCNLIYFMDRFSLPGK